MCILILVCPLYLLLLVYLEDVLFYTAMRAKGWEYSKDIRSPDYQCTLFALRFTLGLLNTYVLNLTWSIRLLLYRPPFRTTISECFYLFLLFLLSSLSRRKLKLSSRRNTPRCSFHMTIASD